MRFVLPCALFALLPALPVTAQKAPAVGAARLLKPACQDIQRRVAQSGQGARVHPMTQEPNTQLIQTVLRSENGCTRPVVVRDDIGALRR